jgi:nucleoid DNA-binding protein
MVMNEAELVKVLAKETGETVAAAKRFLETLKNKMIDELYDNNQFVLYGIGSFKVRKSPATTARNPQTGGTVRVPEQKRVSFKVQKRLRSVLNPQLK